MSAGGPLLDRLSREARADARYVSLHTMDPGTTGAHEISVPKRYTRQRVEWTQAGRNQESLRFAVDRDDGNTTKVGFIGYWDSLVGGAFQCAGPTEAADVRDDYEIAQGKLSLTVST